MNRGQKRRLEGKLAKAFNAQLSDMIAAVVAACHDGPWHIPQEIKA